MLPPSPQSLQLSMWHHNNGLEVVMDIASAQREAVIKQSVTTREPMICFHKEGGHPAQKNQVTPSMTLLSGGRD